MDGGLAVGTLPTSLGAGPEVRAATSKRRVVALLLGACVIAYTFLVPSITTSAVGWALQAAVRANVDPCAGGVRGLRTPRSTVPTLQQWGDSGRGASEPGRVAPRKGYPFPIPMLLASTATAGSATLYDLLEDDQVMLFWYPKADTPG